MRKAGKKRSEVREQSSEVRDQRSEILESPLVYTPSDL
jgi:hypothetical protein